MMRDGLSNELQNPAGETQSVDPVLDLVWCHRLTPEQAIRLVAKYGTGPAMLHVAASELKMTAPNG